MVELPNMSVEEFSRHLGEALSQEQPLPSPCLWCPQLCAAFHWFSPTSCGRGLPWPWLYVAWTVAVFVFFSQVGLWMALCRCEAVADRPIVPRCGHHSVSSYPFPSWSRPSDRC
jgi:hypothetical protein